LNNLGFHVVLIRPPDGYACGMTAHHLAQVNIARMLAPIDSPVMAAFVAQLDAINALADGHPGFVWRLVGAGGPHAHRGRSPRPADAPARAWRNAGGLYISNAVCASVNVGAGAIQGNPGQSFIPPFLFL
jgi:hypothetical protein